MRSNKRYTNTNFTKRVDHEAGRHRPARAPREPAVCKSCGAVYARRRWTDANADRGISEPKHWRPASVTTCPGCKQKQSGSPGGYLRVEGSFVIAHRKEIEQLLRNEAGRAAMDNPLGCIMNLAEGGEGKFTLATTTEHLAQRLGQALEKAYGGTVHYDFSHENKLARVKWSRN